MDIETILEGVEGLDKETSKKIIAAFNEAVEKKAKIVVENNLSTLKKRMYQSVKERARIAFAKTASVLYNESVKSINEDAVQYKEKIVQGLESFIEAYMEESIPQSIITEAAQSRVNNNLISLIKEHLAVDHVMSNEKFKGAMKIALEENKRLKNKVNVLVKENVEVNKFNTKFKAAVVFKELTVGMTDKQREFLVERFKGKDATYIKNNFPSAKKLMLESIGTGTAQANGEQKAPTSNVKPDESKVKLIKEQAAANIAKKKAAIVSQDDTMSVLVEQYIDIQKD